MRVHEIFLSYNGEVGTGQGKPAIFVRFAGCNLRCPWCDTKGANEEGAGTDQSIFEIINQVERLSECAFKTVTITGGEPLMQKEKDLEDLVRMLTTLDYHVGIETNGSLPIPSQFLENEDVTIIMDWKPKLDGSPNPLNFLPLRKQDWIKFPIFSHSDYSDAKRITKKLMDQGCEAEFAFSPIEGGTLPAKDLAFLLLNDSLFYITLNIQLHKVIQIR